MPYASLLSFESAWSRAKSWKSLTEIAVVMTPASTIPARNTRGSRTRSEPSIRLRLSPRLLGVLRRRDFVPDTPHGDDRRRVLQLAAQLAHVDVDRPR